MTKNINQPSVSVIIPAYNAENTLNNCIDSIINQTYKGNIEVIIINDGSNDNTENIAKDYQKKYSNIFLISKENGGVSSARNEGIKQSKHEYIAFCDSDDSWNLNKLEIQINFLLNNRKIDFLGSVLNDKNKFEIKEINLKMMLFKNYFQPSTVIMKSEIISKVGYFDETMKYAEEGNYFYRILGNNFRCFLLGSKLTKYGFNKKPFGESGLSSNLKEMQKGEIRNLIYAYRNLNISIFIFLYSIIYSQAKFIRRIIINKITK